MPAGDIYQCTAEMNMDNQDIVNVYHFVQIGADGTGDPRQKVGLIWLANFETPLLACMTADVQIDVLRIRRISPTTTQSFITTVGTTGGLPGASLATNQVAVLRLYATKAGRKGIGNLRIPGIDNTFINEGQIDASYVGILEIFGLAFEVDQTDVASGYSFRSVVLGTDGVGRQVQIVRATSRIKQLRSRTIGQGQ